MRRHLGFGFVALAAAAFLAACGGAGQHLGEFQTQTPGPTQVGRIALAMPVIPGRYGGSGTFTLEVTAYAGGVAIPYGTNLVDGIRLTSNYPGYVQFQSPTGPQSKRYNSLNLEAAPAPIKVYYKRPPRVVFCNGINPDVYIISLNHTANPPTSDIDLTACPSPSPTTSPTTGPTTGPSGSPKPTPTPTTSPTPTPTPLPAVKRLVLSMPTTPNPLSPGTFTLVVAAYNSAGRTITPGTVLVNPIQLTSNSTCSISFISGGGGASSLTLPSAPGSVNIGYTPPSAACTPPSLVTISAFDLDAKQTATFSLLGGTDTVTSLALSLLAVPDPQSAGVYPLFITAKDASGATIPFGVSLTNPIQLSSNAACSTTFGITTNPSSFTKTFRITSTQTQVYMSFNPAPNCSPPLGGSVIVQAIASGTPTVNTTISFPY